ncbi:MAG: glycoside hydrolase family 76 protein [Candidatus Sulfotelmatobacter sp.]
MKRDFKWLLAVMAAPLLFWAMPLGAREPARASGDDSVRQAQLAIYRLQEWYDPRTGLWKTTGWWNAANALTTIIDFSRATHSTQYREVIAGTYAANARGKFLNEAYDDEGWWALAWIDAYDLTGDRTYLRTASTIFDDMTSGWDDTCGGGIWWMKDRKYKNAIANELLLSVAAHLANRVEDRSQRARYDGWAIREWNWFQRTGMIESDNLISDGLNGRCEDNHQTKWSYNQGVIVGGLTELSRGHGEGGVLREARRIADAAVEKLADKNGILHDPCEPECGPDGTQFKGIFVRNLAALTARSPSARYKEFITANAESLLQHDQGSDHSFGTVWSGPPRAATAASQSSAIDALVAVLRLRKSQP